MKQWIAALLGVLFFGSAIVEMDADEVDFNFQILPILSNNCFKCHGPDARTREADLRLDTAKSALADRGGYQAIKPGDSAASEVVKRLMSNDADERMPPAETGKTLTAAEIELVKRWIDSGAQYRPHWAFVPVHRPELPKVNDAGWPRNPIDRFTLGRMEREGLASAVSANRETLVRRVSFDVTGLPPTIAEIDAFLADRSPRAYDKMVDRYLKSPGYGEHMARRWLDLARYADSNGYQYDTERQQWVWRDWVIHAYNTNKPFDAFTVEQLAGDLIPDATDQQRLATGFNRNHGITIEGGVIDEEYRTEYVVDRVNTTSTVWLGLSIGCARCHNHKFDPISQTEFYQLFAYFNQVPERGNSGFNPKLQVASPLADGQRHAIAAEIAVLEKQLGGPEDDVTVKLQRWAKELAGDPNGGWSVLDPTEMQSSGGSKFIKLEDHSLVVGGANPGKDVYDIVARSDAVGVTAIRLECLTHASLPGGGPGRHGNSNFVLSEFELTVVSAKDPKQREPVKFASASADYSQSNYEIGKTIDGTVAGNNGWAVDGPTRKKPATAIFIAAKPFGFEGGTELRFRLRHEAGFGTHGIGRPRFSVTTDDPAEIKQGGVPENIRAIAAIPAAKRSPAQRARIRSFYLSLHPTKKMRVAAQIKALESKQANLHKSFPATMVMQDLPQPRPTFFLNRGQYDQKGDQVQPGVPVALGPSAPDAPPTRLGFARWLVDPRHPLTARVAVNRYWQYYFGVGLVKTVEDFGIQGEPPSHPELLDWLAAEFVASNWDIKHMQRLILSSATYRQSSRVPARRFVSDPENRLLARGPRLRLEAEEVRDAALAVSGLLVRRVGGASVYPYQPDGLWMELNNRPGYSKKYQRGQGDDLFRRSMYTFWKRTVPSPMMQTFDAPEREFCAARRSRTNTPLQALLLLHGPQFVEAARHFAERMITEGGKTVDERITFGFRLATARRPSTEELAVVRGVYESHLGEYRHDAKAAASLLSVGDSARNRDLDTAEHAAWTIIARLLLNLDEMITKG